MNYTSHYSVLNKESIDYLYEDISDGQKCLFADLTFGGGGHSFAILDRMESSKLISFDQDPEALANGYKNIEEKGLKERNFLVDSNFRHFKEVLDKKFKDLVEENGGVDGVVMDLGVSSHHFDSGERGFSFRVDAPLDMRMDVDNSDIKTAKDIVNTYSGKDLEKILYDYGEEKFTRRIVERILKERESAPIETTFQLADMIRECYPAKLRHGRIHPATKTFQALRIEVNEELKVLTEVIGQIIPFLKINGKIVVISFHSLEDRIVKQEFRKLEKNEDILFEVVTKKPVLPGEKELEENSRSRSAKLRVLKRVEEKKSKNKYAKFSKIEN